MMINRWVVFSHGKRDLEQELWCSKNVGKHRHFSKDDIRKASTESCLQDTLPGPLEVVKALWGLSDSDPAPERKTLSLAAQPSWHQPHPWPCPMPIKHGAGSARTPHILYTSQEKREPQEQGGAHFTTGWL